MPSCVSSIYHPRAGLEGCLEGEAALTRPPWTLFIELVILTPLEVSVLGLPAFLTLSLPWGRRLQPPLAVESRWIMRCRTHKPWLRPRPEPAKTRLPTQSWPAALTEALTSAWEAPSSSMSERWMILKGSSGDGRRRSIITSHVYQEDQQKWPSLLTLTQMHVGLQSRLP